MFKKPEMKALNIPATNLNIDKLVDKIWDLLDNSKTHLTKALILSAYKRHATHTQHQLRHALSAVEYLLDQESIPLAVKQAWAVQLVEEIDHCTPGFHDRVQNILLNYSTETKLTLDHCLYLCRMQWLEAFIRSKTTDVHTHNQFYKVAEKIGLGVYAIYSADPHSNLHMTESKVVDLLLNAKSRYYNLFTVMNSVYDMILDHVKALGYCGQQTKDHSYPMGFYAPVCELFKELFFNTDLTLDDVFILDDNSNIVDINWPTIITAILYTLCTYNYIQLSAPADRFWNIIAQHGLISSAMTFESVIAAFIYDNNSYWFQELPRTELAKRYSFLSETNQSILIDWHIALSFDLSADDLRATWLELSYAVLPDQYLLLRSILRYIRNGSMDISWLALTRPVRKPYNKLLFTDECCGNLFFDLILQLDRQQHHLDLYKALTQNNFAGADNILQAVIRYGNTNLVRRCIMALQSMQNHKLNKLLDDHTILLLAARKNGAVVSCILEFIGHLTTDKQQHYFDPIMMIHTHYRNTLEVMCIFQPQYADSMLEYLTKTANVTLYKQQLLPAHSSILMRVLLSCPQHLQKLLVCLERIDYSTFMALVFKQVNTYDMNVFGLLKKYNLLTAQYQLCEALLTRHLAHFYEQLLILQSAYGGESLVYKHAVQLYNNWNASLTIYNKAYKEHTAKGSIQAQALQHITEQLVTEWRTAMQAEMLILNKHRSCKNIITNVLMILSGIGLLYLIGKAVIDYAQGYGFFARPTVNTRTANIVLNINKEVALLGTSIQQF